MEVDERTNSLIIEDIAAAISKMEELLKKLDTPTPQVLIEARIVEASRSFAKSLGIAWGGAGKIIGRSNLTNIFASPVVSPNTIVAPNIPAISPLGPVPLFLNFPALIPGLAPASLGFLFANVANNFLLGAQLSAAESEGKTKTLSSPRVVTVDNEEAEIRQGTQVPFTTIDASGRTVVSFIDAFIKLKVKPHVTADGRISMKVEAEKSEQGEQITFAGGFAFPIDTQKATTNILVANGSTIVIGGLYRTREQTTETRVPFLSRIPFLGNFFKSRSVTQPEAQNRELLIFLTPTILPQPKPS
jgi:type IV pilus assembly protein PilQ